MSKKSITCMCEHTFEAEFPEKVDLEEKPEIVTEIITGEFMTVTCPSCRKVLKPEFPLLISHRSDGWEIEFVPELERQATMRRTAGPDANKRIVIGYPELIEKIKIITGKLDDRVIEYLKYFILSTVLEKTGDEEKDISVSYHERVGEELFFHIQGIKSDELGVFKIPMATYAKVNSGIDRYASEEPFRGFLTPPYVSLNKLYTWDDDET